MLLLWTAVVNACELLRWKSWWCLVRLIIIFHAWILDVGWSGLLVGHSAGDSCWFGSRLAMRGGPAPWSCWSDSWSWPWNLRVRFLVGLRGCGGFSSGCRVGWIRGACITILVRNQLLPFYMTREYPLSQMLLTLLQFRINSDNCHNARQFRRLVRRKMTDCH